MAQHELIALYSAARRRTDHALPAVGSYVDFSAYQRREAEAAGADHEAVTVWRDFLRDTGGTLPGFELASDPDDPPEPADSSQPEACSDLDSADLVPQGSLTADLLDDEQTNRFTAVCSAAGGSLSSGVLAALAAVYAELGGGPVMRCVIPRHTRGDQQWFGALGWFVATVPFRLDTSDASDFGQLIGRASDEMRRVRKAGTLPFLRIAEILRQPDGDPGHHADHDADEREFPEPKFVVSFIDLRFAPGHAEADAGRARVLRSHNYSGDEVYIWINRTASGLRISSRFPSRGRTHSQVGRYLSRFSEFVKQIGDQSTFGSLPASRET